MFNHVLLCILATFELTQLLEIHFSSPSRETSISSMYVPIVKLPAMSLDRCKVNDMTQSKSTVTEPTADQ